MLLRVTPRASARLWQPIVGFLIMRSRRMALRSLMTARVIPVWTSGGTFSARALVGAPVLVLLLMVALYASRGVSS